MKIKDYGLTAIYVPAFSEALIQEKSINESWPNLLISDIQHIRVLYMGHQIAKLYASGADYDGVRKDIVMNYYFPKSDNDDAFNTSCESMSFKMTSKGKDLRPTFIPSLQKECEVIMNSPETSFQLTIAQSLVKFLGENGFGIKASARALILDAPAQRETLGSRIKRLFSK